MIEHVDRRSFLKLTGLASAGLVIGWPDVKAATTKHELTAFLAIDAKGDVTIVSARPEAGQGSRTGLAMIVAEEACVDWARVKVVAGDLDARYGQQYMAGSTATRESWTQLRKAGAAARMMLIAAAAKRWNVPEESCVAELGVVMHKPSSRRAAYGELVADAAKLDVPKEPKLLDPGSFRLIGKSIKRVDNTPIVSGTAIYGIDVRLPGMLYAAVLRPPELGASVAAFDATKAKAVRGVRDVFVLETPNPPAHYTWGGVAVLADSTWAAFEGQRALEVTWKSGPNAGEGDLMPKLRELAAGSGAIARDEGHFDATTAASTLEATYELPWLAHATMEPMNCTVWLHDGIAEVWAPTQALASAAKKVAAATGLAEDKVRLHVTLLGGGFGRRLNNDYAWEAAMVAKRAGGAPVKLTYTREDDMTHDYYRPLSHHRLAATFDAEQKLTGWRHHIASPSINAFYGAAAGDPAEGVIGGADDLPLAVPNIRVEYSLAPTSLPRGWLRGVEHPANAFATQSFLDEIAERLGKDPLAFRLEMLAGDRKIKGKLNGDAVPPLDVARMRRVVEAVTAAAKWGTPLAQGKGRGIAFHYSRSYVAEVVEVSMRGNEPHVDRVVCAIDCGTVVNPDSVRANAEGGVLFALTAALYGQITFKNGAAEQSNFHDFPLARMSDMPHVDVVIVPSSLPPEGVGEVFVPPLAPALAGAIFAATGKRIRRLPLAGVL